MAKVKQATRGPKANRGTAEQIAALAYLDKVVNVQMKQDWVRARAERARVTKLHPEWRAAEMAFDEHVTELLKPLGNKVPPAVTTLYASVLSRIRIAGDVGFVVGAKRGFTRALIYIAKLPPKQRQSIIDMQLDADAGQRSTKPTKPRKRGEHRA
ncbi:MAG TPA: hypothetical protein VGM88_03265 [Kofleriaceae bacterium]|jgi:hypothetical protein